MGEAAAEKDKSKKETIEIDLNTVILAGLERGLTMQDIRRMQLGQVVDFVVDYNKRQKQAERKTETGHKVKHYRLATRDETDMMLRS